MDFKLEFVRLALAEGANRRELCRRFGISATLGYRLLSRYAAQGDAWKPEWLVYYFINGWAEPSFVIDVSEHYETKRRALACHTSQFTPGAQDRAETRLTSPLFHQLIESRDAQFGARTGVRWAEGFVVREPVVRRNLLKRRPAGARAL